MRHRIYIFSIMILAGQVAMAQVAADKPKLVVGIVVDQMRQEYLYRFYEKFGTGGFKKLVSDGFMVKNAHYNYVPTVTGPGHASVYTGTTPAIHGIIGNEFYDKRSKSFVNCVEDSMYKTVGVDVGNGDVSPWRMLSSTVTDELKLSTQGRSKVIGISIKDRGAVLPGGHMADAAYWYDGASGRFISSTYYMKALPAWAAQFNALKLPEKYLSQDWNTLLPIEQYTESGPDDTPYEGVLGGQQKSTFPYKLNKMRTNGSYDLLTGTPFANDLLTEMAFAAIAGEKLGNHDVTDFLCISYSATDAVGHRVGPNAIELEDTYLRLDRNVEELLKRLDHEVGAGMYTVFLTADHAVADVPQYLMDKKVPAGYLNSIDLQGRIENFLSQYYPGRKFIENISNLQIFLNQDAFRQDPKTSGLDMYIVTELIGKYLMTVEGVANYYTEAMLRDGNYDEGGIKGAIIRGYHAKRSGDIVISMEPGWLDSSSTQGTSHGSPYRYDTHVPMLFYGYGIRKGSSVRYHPITDIAPTISVLLKIKFPNGCSGNPIPEIFE